MTNNNDHVVFFLLQRRTARIIADSILNLKEQGLISCNYSESGMFLTVKCKL